MVITMFTHNNYPVAVLAHAFTTKMSIQATKRFDGRLDSFLRRNLTLESYERVVSTEPCVVVTPEGKRAPRHVVLGHGLLYFTEMPPKTLTKALRLEDVLTVKAVSEVWCFDKKVHKTLKVTMMEKSKIKILFLLLNKINYKLL